MFRQLLPSFHTNERPGLSEYPQCTQSTMEVCPTQLHWKVSQCHSPGSHRIIYQQWHRPKSVGCECRLSSAPEFWGGLQKPGWMTHLETTIDADMYLNIYKRTIIFEPLKSVPGITMLLMVAIRGSTVWEKNHNLVDRLWVLGKIVLWMVRYCFITKTIVTYPEHIRIFQVSLRVSLLSVNEVGEFSRVTDEEDRGVIEHPVQVTLISPQFDSKSTGIPGSISRTILASNSRESDSCFNPLTDRFEEWLRSDVTEIVSDFKVPMSTSSFGMYLKEIC